ncbi:MAG: DUF4190 domain-containing protein [Chloroflexota bacterium]|nr:DUF4190 domain-containing protein [Chloroflexota bacterium]
MSDYSTAPSRPNSSMAVISLVAGILGLTLFPTIGSIAAVITGSLAKKEIQQSAGTLGGEGLARAGVILGWIGIALAILGICIVGVVFLVPLCLATFGIASEEFGILLPIVFLMI